MFNSRAPNRQIKAVIFNGQYSLDKKTYRHKLKFSKLNTMNIEERLKRLFTATPEQLRAIDSILESGILEKPARTSVPLFLGMSDSAKLLGISRTTLWRMTNLGVLQKVEILPGSFRHRRADLEAVAAGQKEVVPP
jgi:hypothetical protein